MPRPTTVIPPMTLPWMRQRTCDRPDTTTVQMPGVLLVNVAADAPEMGVQGSGYHSVPFSDASNSTTPLVPAGAADGELDGLTDPDGLTLALGLTDADGLMDRDADGDRLRLALEDGDALPEGEADADGLRDCDALGLTEPDGLMLALPDGLADADGLTDSETDGLALALLAGA